MRRGGLERGLALLFALLLGLAEISAVTSPRCRCEWQDTYFADTTCVKLIRA